MRRRVLAVPRKMKGTLRGIHAPLSLKYALWGAVTGALAILGIFAVTRLAGCPLFIGSFGASVVLLFGAAESPLAQPRNLIGGHLVSAAVAVALVALGCTGTLWAAGAVGFAILAMYLTRTVHPPGGATALIGVQSLVGPAFLLVPVLAGTLVLLLFALVSNNLVHHRQYPKHWI